MKREQKPKVQQPQPLFEPWRPPDNIVLSEVVAVKALFNGTATAEQQRDGMHYIISRVCGAYEDPFCPGEDGRRNTDYALGKRRVALHLISLIHAPLANFKDPDAAPTEQG